MFTEVFAGNTGKIIGKVTDVQSGEPLPGVNILVLTTTRGANSDADGKYTIIGIPIGTYAVKASLVGYQEVEIQGVKVGADETTNLDYKMTQTAVDLPTVIITADQKLVNSLTTSSTQTLSSKAIEQIPNVKEVQDIIKLQAGVVKQGNNLFLRGGRANEVQYLVDGIATNNILSNSGALAGGSNKELQSYYSGLQSGTIGGGASGLEISANAIQSVSVQTSGFDADYGNAQSGVVNIVTKSGGEKYTGSAQFRTDRLFSDNQNEAYSSFTFGGPEPITKYLFPTMGVNVPGALSFFYSADITRSDGPYQFVHNEFYNPLERKVALSGFLGGLLNGLNFGYRDNQDNKFTFNSKLKWDMSGSDQISYGYRASLSSTHNFNNTWKYRADSSSVRSKLSTQNVLSWTHFFGANSFVRIILGSLRNHEGSSVGDMKPFEYPYIRNNQDPNADGFNELGSAQGWSSSKTQVYTVRFDLNSQIHPLHLVKTGFEFNYEQISSTEIQYPTGPYLGFYPPYPDTSKMYQDLSRGEYPGYGTYRWALNNYPNRGAAYIQDNIEFSGLNIHLGLRYDYLDIGSQVFDEKFIRDWYTAVNGIGQQSSANDLKAEWAERDNNGNFTHLKSGSTFLWYVTHGYLSPRLSIGYPVTDRIVFYFNYGHFLQYPERDNYYRDPSTLGSSGNWVGNPDLKPQKTVSYEAGFEDQFTDDMAFKLNAFYKDIFDYSTLVERKGRDVSVFFNFDYSSARGFEAALSQAFTGNFSSNISYSYQLNKGRSSNSLATVYSPQSLLPRETRLDWNQDHTINALLSYRVSPKEDGTFFGLPFVNNYGISLTWSYGSGYPYTPYFQTATAYTLYLNNSKDRPYTSLMSLNAYKGFYVFEKINLIVSLDITNLLNRKNVQSGSADGGFNTSLGRPFEYGDADIVAKRVYSYRSFESRVPPTVFDSPRQILLGIRLNWE